MAYRNIALSVILLSCIQVVASNYLNKPFTNGTDISTRMRRNSEGFISEILSELQVHGELPERIGVPSLRWSYVDLPGLTMYLPTFGNGTVRTNNMRLEPINALKITKSKSQISLTQTLRTNLEFDYQFNIMPRDHRPLCSGSVRENIENFEITLKLTLELGQTCRIAEIDVSSDGQFHKGKLTYQFNRPCYEYRPPLVEGPKKSFKKIKRSMRTLLAEDSLKRFLKLRVKELIKRSKSLQRVFEQLCEGFKSGEELSRPRNKYMPIFFSKPIGEVFDLWKFPRFVKYKRMSHYRPYYSL